MSTATRPRRRPGSRARRRLERSPRRLSRRGRRRLMAAGFTVLVAFALYLAVVRDLPYFRIEAVELAGASSGYSPRLLADLEAAAKTMTTLHVDEERLEDVAGRYPAVISLETDADLPNRLSVVVDERPPVGVVRGPGGRRVPVAGDGSILDGQPVDRPLPILPGPASGGRTSRATTASAAALAAAAPRPLAAWLERLRRGPEGWTVELRDGPELRFGSLADVPLKWSAAAAVLRSRAARGARYVDLRLPDRPSAGGFPERPKAEAQAPAENAGQAPQAAPASGQSTASDNAQVPVETLSEP